MVNQGSRLPSANSATSKSSCVLFSTVALGAALVLFPAVATAAPSGLRKGPYLQDLTSDSADVRWELDPPGRAEVELATPTGEKRRFRATDAPAAFQTVRLTGLTPKTAYRYRVVVLDGAKETTPPEGEGSFTTAPPPGDTSPIRFVVYGDDRTDDAAHAAVARGVAKAPGDFLVNTGDMVEDGSQELDWQHFFEIERGVVRDRCLFAAVGNHELVQSSGEAFLRYFGELPAAPDGGAAPFDRRRFVRSMRWGNARFLFLNGMDTFASTEERKWLDAEIARTDAEPGVTFRFVVLHHGPYSSGPHGNNPRLWNAGIVDLLRGHHIDMVWAGHDHIYERGDGNGLKYVVAGGGGAPLYPVRKRLSVARVVEPVHHFIEVTLDGQNFAMVARRVDGSVLDKCGFAKGGPWDCDQVAAPAPSTPTPAPTVPPSGSRCGCELPGASQAAAGFGEAAFGALALAFAWLRRRARR